MRVFTLALITSFSAITMSYLNLRLSKPLFRTSTCPSLSLSSTFNWLISPCKTVSRASFRFFNCIFSSSHCLNLSSMNFPCKSHSLSFTSSVFCFSDRLSISECRCAFSTQRVSCASFNPLIS
ncbi:hypothetical protein OIU74_024880 [Salix koriyanagi]|uniref:Uncharacterized protein n=1 Tax=Salix koriyanagi TaxID=2511006 RepID=A0A9Q1A8Y8_9ROSI|nr:hypothetical protein OIU74_024880 [Salix koriyanagi]